MAITDSFVLAADVVLLPVSALSPQVREQVKCDDTDYAITRPRARTPSRIIDSDAAQLLQEFQAPKTIVEAIIAYSHAKEADPDATLSDAFPMLQRLMQAQLLVPADSHAAQRIDASFAPGDDHAGLRIVRPIQVLEDTELYQCQHPDGRIAALKIARPGAPAELPRMFEREAAILRHLDGMVTPELLDDGAAAERPYLVIEWCPGVVATVLAGELRDQGGSEGRGKLLALGVAIVEAYARLHRQHVIHSDVHPRNVLVDATGAVKLIDFGLARLEGVDSRYRKAHRGGVGFFFEPEYARAREDGHSRPQSSLLGEQYAVAALLYFLFTGAHYLDFSYEKNEMMRQIAHENPLPFTHRDVAPWIEVEQVLARALRKDPAERFSSMAELAANLRAIDASNVPHAPAHVETTAPADWSAAASLLDTVLQRIGCSGPRLTSGITTAPTASLTYGTGGIAYALYRIACASDDPELLSLADVWASKATQAIGAPTAFYSDALEITPKTVGTISPYHTASGVHSVQALISRAMVDVVSQQEALDAFVGASRAPCENLDLTLGRAGTLVSCALLLDATRGVELVDNCAVAQLGEETVADIWERVAAYPSIDRCAAFPNLGIAHGWAGLLYATLLWCRTAQHPMPASIEQRLAELAACAQAAGRGVRWPWIIHRRHREPGDTYMPGWCNGSAGFVHVWTLAYQVFGHNQYLSLAERAGWNAWEEHDSISSLCCGLAGQAYALLNLYTCTADASWLHRAQELANRAALQSQTPDSFSATFEDSLYKGALGVAVLAADLGRPELACMPFFEAEGWPAPATRSVYR